MTDELDLETRIELTIIGLETVKARLEELDKQMNEFEEWLESWKR